MAAASAEGALNTPSVASVPRSMTHHRGPGPAADSNDCGQPGWHDRRTSEVGVLAHRMRQAAGLVAHIVFGGHTWNRAHSRRRLRFREELGVNLLLVVSLG